MLHESLYCHLHSRHPTFEPPTPSVEIPITTSSHPNCLTDLEDFICKHMPMILYLLSECLAELMLLLKSIRKGSLLEWVAQCTSLFRNRLHLLLLILLSQFFVAVIRKVIH
jgi:hypothetical protein